MRKIVPAIIAVTLPLALALTACAPEDQTDPNASSSPSASPTSEQTAAPTTAPSPEESAGVELPTADTIDCDAMLDPLVDDGLRAGNLVPAPKEWTQFNFEPTLPAIECPWGYEGDVHAITYYAWAALAEGEAEKFLALTAENGYTSETDGRGTWVTNTEEDPEGSSGILVTDDWVAFAPTRELVSAIVWTR